jgi:TonB family protein
MPISKANLPFPSNFGAAVREDRSSSPPTRSFSFPLSPKPQSTAKFTPTPVNSPIPARSDSSEQARASNPLPANPLPSPTPLTSDRSIEPIQPTPAISKPLTRSANNLQQPKDPPRSIVSMTGSANDNPLVGSNNARQVKPSNPTGGGVVPKQSGTNPVNSSAMSSTNTSGDRSNTNNGASTGNPGAVNAVGKADGKIGGVATGNNSGNGSGNSGNGSGDSGNGSGNSGLQCIQNCQIAKLQDLQDRDSGKDRLRIRVTIDANGIVTAAEIAKSSGNPQLDQTVLNGIERMQFQPSGKPGSTHQNRIYFDRELLK